MEADINLGGCGDLHYLGAKLDHLMWERGRSGESQHAPLPLSSCNRSLGTSVALADTLILGASCP